MSSSRFSHFNKAIYSGFTDEDQPYGPEDNQHLSNSAMTVTAGMCFRSGNSIGKISETVGSFVTVTIEDHGHFSDPKPTVVKPDEDDSRVHIHSFDEKSLMKYVNNNIGHVTFGIKHEDKLIKNNLWNERGYDLEHSCRLPILNPYIEYSEDWAGHGNVCSDCIIL